MSVGDSGLAVAGGCDPGEGSRLSVVWGWGLAVSVISGPGCPEVSTPGCSVVWGPVVVVVIGVDVIGSCGLVVGI